VRGRAEAVGGACHHLGVLTALLYLVVMVAVAAVVFLFASLVFGRGEEMAPLAPGATPTWLPERGVTGKHVRELRFQQAVRGYKMSEVDWALRRVASELDALRERVAELEGVQLTGSEPGIDARGGVQSSGEALGGAQLSGEALGGRAGDEPRHALAEQERDVAR
jgi:DivIVA domain-containing protein